MTDLERIRRDSGIIGTSDGIDEVLEMILPIEERQAFH